MGNISLGMKYESLYDEFVEMFPEDLEFFNELAEESSAEREDGMHIMFGMVVCPFILKIADKDPKKAQLAFDFIEEMGKCSDDRIVNVAEVTVLEDLMTDENGGMKKLGKYLGEESRKTVMHLSQFFHIDMNEEMIADKEV